MGFWSAWRLGFPDKASRFDVIFGETHEPYCCSINSKDLNCNSLGLTWILGGQRIKLDCKKCKRSEEKSTEGSSSFTENAWKMRMLSKSKGDPIIDDGPDGCMVGGQM